MKTLLTFATLSLILLGSLGTSAQTRQVRRSVNNKPLIKIQVGAQSKYSQQSFLVNRVQQLEQIVNIMQDRILDIEYEMSMLSRRNIGVNQYFCEIIGESSGHSYTAQARTKMQASSQAYSKCVNNDGSFWCERDKVNCDQVDNRR